MHATPMAKDFGVSTPTTFAAFSVALVVSALLGPAPPPHELRFDCFRTTALRRFPATRSEVADWRRWVGYRL
ncbi:hypothetical protein CYJ10_26860 [Cupriavidus pauculus]|uniref:Uncharacterized protein n=1 Tax=Cupriavidus pauculus TaxID=82633 RepID=A0A2N5C5L0_9BURK|nr:hypothetical protein CYJ10_26860 [Cupriavidus pauculus]